MGPKVFWRSAADRARACGEIGLGQPKVAVAGGLSRTRPIGHADMLAWADRAIGRRRNALTLSNWLRPAARTWRPQGLTRSRPRPPNSPGASARPRRAAAIWPLSAPPPQPGEGNITLLPGR